MGLLDPLLADDLDDFAGELLRREDPEPLELLERVLTEGALR